MFVLSLLRLKKFLPVILAGAALAAVVVFTALYFKRGEKLRDAEQYIDTMEAIDEALDCSPELGWRDRLLACTPSN